MSIHPEDSTNGQDMAAEFVSTFYDSEDCEDQASVGETEAGDLFDLYDHSRPLTPSSIKGEEGSDEVVSELDGAQETSNLSAEKRARLSTSTIKTTEEKDISTEVEYSLQISQDESLDCSEEKDP